MFTRVVEVTAKPGKSRELIRIVNDKIMTILKNQPGFVDELVLLSEENPDQVLGLSFWLNREQAENYNRQHFPEIIKLLQPVSEGPPKLRVFQVEQSTIQKIVAGKAA